MDALNNVILMDFALANDEMKVIQNKILCIRE